MPRRRRLALLAALGGLAACARVETAHSGATDGGLHFMSHPDLAMRAADLRMPAPVRDLATSAGCGGGGTMCGGACVNTNSDPMNCGACGQLCPGGQTCTGGQCQAMCANGQIDCGGACVDPSSDDNNCGACGNACGGGMSCTGGQCRGPMCQAPMKSCGGVCTDVSSDESNCGACGAACAVGKTCVGGVCTAMAMPGQVGCAGAVQCLNGCASNACQTRCLNKTTAQGRALLDALLACLEQECPSSPGGICDQFDFFYDPVLCNQCYQDAQAKNGNCGADWTACKNDLP